MNASSLIVTLEFSPRPWWRPLGLRATSRWYQELRRVHHGRLVAALVALYLGRREARFL